MAELIIRKAAEADAEQIEALEQVCFQTPWSYESILHEIKENKMATYIVAELAGRIVGYVGYWAILDEGHINNVAVSPLYRRQHIGTILIETMLNAAQKAGIARHTLEVRAGNEEAKGLYKKFGFEEAGCRKGYYEDSGEDAIIMWRG